MLGMFLRPHTRSLSLKSYNLSVPSLLSRLVLYNLPASFLFLQSKQQFFSASIYFPFPLELRDSFSFLCLLQVVLRPPHLVPFTDGTAKYHP